MLRRRPLLISTATLSMVLLVMRLLVVLLLVMPTTAIPSLISRRLRGQRWRRFNPPASQVDIDAALVLLGGIVKPQLLAQTLDAGLDLLHVARRVVPLADNDMQVILTGALGVADALLEDILGLLDELAVQVNGVLGDATGCVVLAEDELGGLLVVLGLLPLMLLAFV
jgi:hypothetical protein